MLKRNSLDPKASTRGNVPVPYPPSTPSTVAGIDCQYLIPPLTSGFGWIDRVLAVVVIVAVLSPAERASMVRREEHERVASSCESHSDASFLAHPVLMAASLDSSTLHLALEPPKAGSSSSSSTSIHTSASTRPPLSERLHRFWTERGDFSKFSLQDLAQQNDDTHDDADHGSSSKKSKQGEVVIDWGLDGGEKQYVEEINQLLLQGKANTNDGATPQDTINTEPLTIEEFVQLKEEMMGRLHVAQQSLYSSQALVALLVAANRSKPAAETAAATTAATRNVSLAPSAVPSPSRAESPAAGSSTSGAPSVEKRHPPGSVAAVEAEFGLDPHSIALTSIERTEVTRRAQDQQQPDDSKTNAVTADQLDFANDAERKEYTSRLQSSLAQKRRDVSSAISILRRGATQLRNDTGASTKTARLLTAQRDGWGLTPGRPGQSVFAPTSVKHRSDEGEQDAWIGYAVPESRAVYRRTALAYFSDQAADDDGLVFHARRNKRLKVTCVIAGQTQSTQSGTQSTQESSSSSSSTRLKAAQEELLDAELFDELAVEARSLSSLGLVDTQHDENGAVTIGLAHSQAVEIKFEMVGTQVSTTDTDANAEASVSSPPPLPPSSPSSSPYASLVLSTARLFLVKKYQERANAERDRKRKAEEEERKNRRGAGRRQPVEQDDANKKKANATSSQQQPSDAERAAEDAKNPFKQAPSLMPVLGLLHYLSVSGEAELGVFLPRTTDPTMPLLIVYNTIDQHHLLDSRVTITTTTTTHLHDLTNAKHLKLRTLAVHAPRRTLSCRDGHQSSQWHSDDFCRHTK